MLPDASASHRFAEVSQYTQYNDSIFSITRCPNSRTAAKNSFPFQAGHCYPESGAPNFGGGRSTMSADLSETGTPQECYNYCLPDYDPADFCAAETAVNSYMGLALELDTYSSSGHRCMCNRPGGHTSLDFGWSRLERGDQGLIRAQANMRRTTTTT